MIRLVLVITLALIFVLSAMGCSGDDGGSASETEAPGDISNASDVIDKVKSSVVVVNNLSVVTEADGSEGFEVQATGSGVVVDENGGVITNLHVIAGADRIRVQTRDGRGRTARIVATLGDTSDLALLRVERADGLEPVVLGRSGELEIGDGTVVLGNPVGIGLSAATGVISARGRVVETPDGVLFDVLQTDAAVNPGNSGGALLDAQGNLIGINTAVRVEAEGIGFAIPVDHVRAFIKAVEDEAAIPFIGTGFVTFDEELLAANDVDNGVGVLAILPDGPAQQGGLASDDIITEVDGALVATATEVAEAIAGKKPEEAIRLRVIRQTFEEDEVIDVDVVVGGMVPRFPKAQEDDG